MNIHFVLAADKTDLMESTLATFLESLLAEGRVRVAAPAEIRQPELLAADQVLANMDALCRNDLSGEPPPLAPDVARWGAVMFYRACQFVAYRDVGEAQMDVAFGPPCPGNDGASKHYSVDLTFRYLPDLLKLARGASESDPLLERLKQWAVDWPLSSVGVANITLGSIEAIVRDDCLLRLYTDRIIQRRDRSRLTHPRVRECLSEAIGVFNDLAPEMADALKSADQPQQKVS